MEFNLTVFLVGTLGGALGELLKWFELRQSVNFPEYAKSLFYWIITILMALAGGVLAWLYGIESTKLLLALNVGITAPLILKGLASVAPPQPGSRDLDGPAPSVLNFIAGR